MSTRAVDVTDGKAEVAVDLTPDLYGTLELHAYKILRSGSITRDTRLVVVDEANDLAVTLTPGADTYKPGEDAVLDVLVNGTDGAGVHSAVGLAVVDESVFALAEQDPGFAKLYFMLEAELLQPKYELHGFGIPEMIAEPYPVDDPVLREAQEGAGKAALASAVRQASPFQPGGEFARSGDAARVREASEVLHRRWRPGCSASSWLLPLAMMVLSGIAVWKNSRFWASLGIAFGALIVLALVMVGIWYGWWTKSCSAGRSEIGLAAGGRAGFGRVGGFDRPDRRRHQAQGRQAGRDVGAAAGLRGRWWRCWSSPVFAATFIPMTVCLLTRLVAARAAAAGVSAPRRGLRLRAARVRRRRRRLALGVFLMVGRVGVSSFRSTTMMDGDDGTDAAELPLMAR